MTETTSIGTILQGIGGFYIARDDGGREYTLRAQGKLRRERLKPKVGDRVEMMPGEGEEHGWLEEILPRTSECLRPPVANVALLLIVVAPVPLIVVVPPLIVVAPVPPIVLTGTSEMKSPAPVTFMS